jgi:hypothetical protein
MGDTGAIVVIPEEGCVARTMRVEVHLDLRELITDDVRADLERAAATFTEDPRSVQVDAASTPSVVVVRFTMPRAAQYKVVDAIADAFGRALDGVGWRDIAITFPRGGRGGD